MLQRYIATALVTGLLGACASESPATDPTQQAADTTDGNAPGCDTDNGGIELPDGFCAFVVADEIGRARHLWVHDNGDIYVALRSSEGAGGVVALRDTDGDGRADVKEQFGDHYGTGIEIHDGYLYFGTNSSIIRYEMSPGELVPTAELETVIDGFPDQRTHAVKPFAFDDRGHIFVNVGAPSNACQEEARTESSPGQNPCPQRQWQASIWRFDANRVGQTQKEDGYRYSSGIRNSVAIAWNDASQAIYVVQHGRDQLDTLWPDLFDAEYNAENPGEEFLELEDGADFMWPYCYYDTRLEKKILAPEYGGDGEEVGDCDMAPEPLVVFPGHWGPNDLVFYDGEQFPERYRGGAFVAFHGSWNRAPLPQGGYNIVFVPMKNGAPSGDWEVFADGFKGAEVLESPRDALYRPTGVAQGPDGSLYVSDSLKGRIWRIVYRS